MEIDPGDLLLFARIVECGSFSLAAQRVQLPKSTVSRRISLLEAQLGERLLQRTTRKLVLTEFGASLLEHARRVADETEMAGALAQHRQGAPSGLLRVSMPADFANLTMGGMMARFMNQYPAISLELDLSPRRVDLVAENFDLAIRMGNLPDDASLAARRVTLSKIALYASPLYTSLRGLPEHPDDLFRHDLLSLPPRLNGLIRWKLLRGKVEWEREMPVRLMANSPEILVRMAASGVGIAASTELFAREYLQSGELVRVLPEWAFPVVTGWAVFPGRRLMPAKTRVFLDMLETAFEDGRPVER
ncbi:LysR family transcriptional regulator [Duganella sp. BJB488]|uniref:LysR family transcriptional regulator n=1 Tax=unclassified Duganella TaxID=2636909 RepID=UPI000E3547C2|nr:MULTISPECIES: LysR family transcriptional regulator [unclassified Duganella]NVD74152.1 LysR family transcriptional regulator [Duganella sp. BJB1802]RFP21562.1 LysR family transcriptional regulator [Duganella sp. BJB489]RFP23355.1 LysR family transcriptional regulator [Duganella sp. BJB488]RFP38521.1 LysR family transcriptional regulator [Duganella sp. BJB480]